MHKETEIKLVCYLRYVTDNQVWWPTSKTACKYGNTSYVPVQTVTLGWWRQLDARHTATAHSDRAALNFLTSLSAKFLICSKEIINTSWEKSVKPNTWLFMKCQNITQHEIKWNGREYFPEALSQSGEYLAGGDILINFWGKDSIKVHCW